MPLGDGFRDLLKSPASPAGVNPQSFANAGALAIRAGHGRSDSRYRRYCANVFFRTTYQLMRDHLYAVD